MFAVKNSWWCAIHDPVNDTRVCANIVIIDPARNVRLVFDYLNFDFLLLIVANNLGQVFMGISLAEFCTINL